MARIHPITYIFLHPSDVPACSISVILATTDTQSCLLACSCPNACHAKKNDSGVLVLVYVDWKYHCGQTRQQNILHIPRSSKQPLCDDQTARRAKECSKAFLQGAMMILRLLLVGLLRYTFMNGQLSHITLYPANQTGCDTFCMNLDIIDLWACKEPIAEPNHMSRLSHKAEWVNISFLTSLVEVEFFLPKELGSLWHFTVQLLVKQMLLKSLCHPMIFLVASVVSESKDEMWTFVFFLYTYRLNLEQLQNDANWTRYGDTFIGLSNSSQAAVFPSCCVMPMGGLAQCHLKVLDMQTRSGRTTMDLNYVSCWTHNIWQPSTHFFQLGILGGGQWEYLHASTMSYSLLPHTYIHVVSCTIALGNCKSSQHQDGETTSQYKLFSTMLWDMLVWTKPNPSDGTEMQWHNVSCMAPIGESLSRQSKLHVPSRTCCLLAPVLTKNGTDSMELLQRLLSGSSTRLTRCTANILKTRKMLFTTWLLLAPNLSNNQNTEYFDWILDQAAPCMKICEFCYNDGMCSQNFELHGVSMISSVHVIGFRATWLWLMNSRVTGKKGRWQMFGGLLVNSQAKHWALSAEGLMFRYARNLASTIGNIFFHKMDHQVDAALCLATWSPDFRLRPLVWSLLSRSCLTQQLSLWPQVTFNDWSEVCGSNNFAKLCHPGACRWKSGDSYYFLHGISAVHGLALELAAWYPAPRHPETTCSPA